jgi:hypothetical protein
MSEYRTYIVDEKDLGFWDDYISRSEGGTIFHRLEWLKAAADHSHMKLMPVAVAKGKDIVCLMPLFFKKKFGLRILLSPPNRCGISYMGPVLNIPSSDRYKYEWTYISILDEIIHFAEKEIGFDYFRIIHTPAIKDMRPYVWKGYSFIPKYTYIVDLSKGYDTIHSAFSKAARNKLRKVPDNNHVSILRGPQHADAILSLAEERSHDQGIKFRIHAGYIQKLVESSFAANIESVAAMHEGKTIAGSIDLIDGKNVYAWIGSASKEEIVPGVGELILREKIKDFHNRGFTSLDLVDANIRRLCRHKSRYGADLVNYFEVYKTSLKGKIALGLSGRYNRK